MNPVVLYFASGDSLYVGAALLMLVILISPYLKHCWALRIRNISGWLALGMIVMACPPFSWFVDGIFLAAFVLWFLASNTVAMRQMWAGLRLAATAALLALLLVLPAVEFSHRAMPVIAGTPTDHLVVIGDSISSGVDPRVPAWPVVLQEMTGVAVKNLAQPGAQTIEGRVMAEKITPEDHIVLIEIGGNDLLTGTPSSEFGRALDALLSKVSAPGRTLLMFELSLLPNKIAYGQIQRRLATKYRVLLIPKRFLVDVIGGANATSDGLHLSEAGARRMATLMAQALLPVLKSPVATSSPRA
jgi:lysophospholipase L1-like esterase